MKPLKLFITGTILFLSWSSFAQKNIGQHPKRLYIGDKLDLETIAFNNVRNVPGGKAKLSDFKGKYIILDFWNKYCSTCIEAFPDMEKLQKKFNGDIQIILITQDSEKELSKLLTKSTIVKETKLPMVLGDSSLSQKLFPYQSVPYHVWLDREGTVVATTYAQETNSKNLMSLIASKPLNLLERYDLVDDVLINEIKDEGRSLLNIGNGLYLSKLSYYVPIPTTVKSTQIFSLNSISKLIKYPYYSLFIHSPFHVPFTNPYLFLDGNGNGKGFRIYKNTIDDLYRRAYLDSGVNVKKILTEGRAKFLYEDLTDSTDETRRQLNNSWAYESVLPEYSYQKARRLLQQDLVRFFGMKGAVEERSMKCLVLKRLKTSAEKQLWAKDQTLSEEYTDVRKTGEGFLFKNTFISHVFTMIWVTNRAMDDPILIDEIDFSPQEKETKKIDIFLKCNLKCSAKNIENVRRELGKYGLGLIEEVRNVKVLVLKEAF